MKKLDPLGYKADEAAIEALKHVNAVKFQAERAHEESDLVQKARAKKLADKDVERQAVETQVHELKVSLAQRFVELEDRQATRLGQVKTLQLMARESYIRGQNDKHALLAEYREAIGQIGR
jgi:hypothetical protein